ncbi:DUF3102 domain-containing protein [Pseudodesulfovibrio indicus]|uniref:DUF3102 domain-containing protein n=1 Tax=Pseudodesulfovibrio indicus TaxID=1716143 RepID=UPI00292F09EB|nr:DUF3102 domain-containing protein [Pseudodesulfovibrio indicus]
MAIKKNTKKLRSRTRIHKVVKSSAKRTRALRIRKVLEKAEEKLAKFHRRERTTPYFIGREFFKVKKEIGRGKWIEWLKDKQYMSRSTAGTYMAIHRTFESAGQAALFTVVQQGNLTGKRVTPNMLEKMIDRAQKGERWTNESFVAELSKLQGITGEMAGKAQGAKPKEKPAHKGWVEHVEGLVSALEIAREDHRWVEGRKRPRVRKRYEKIAKRLLLLSRFFKSPTVGDKEADGKVYMPKKAMKGHKNDKE